MKTPAVSEAYIGAHHDSDLGETRIKKDNA